MAQSHVENHNSKEIDQNIDDNIELNLSDPSKYVTLPVQNEKIWRKYQTTLDWFWTVYEVNLENDVSSMNEAFNEEQGQYILKVLAFMLVAHNTIVKKELFLELINLVDIKEASYYFGSQADAKKTHSMMYSMLLDELTGNDLEKKVNVISDVAKMPEVRQALSWYVENVILEQQSFAKRILTFATLQGILFTIPFVMFSWIEKQYPSVMTGLMKANNLIWRDERLNLSFSCMLLSYIDDEVEESESIEIVKKAVQHAKNIFLKSLPVSIIGIDCDLLRQFIEHSADSILVDTKNDKIYNIEKTPFDWMVEPKIEMNESTIPNLSTTVNEDQSATNFEMNEDF